VEHSLENAAVGDTSSNLKNSAFYPHCVLAFTIPIIKSYSLSKDDQPVFFVTEKSRVLYESATETLNII
jgi:hypothetical protein